MTLKDTIARLFGSAAPTVGDAADTAEASSAADSGSEGAVTEGKAEAGSADVTASGSNGANAEAPATENTT